MTTNSTRVRTFNQSHNVLAFPLGGIGTGNVSLGARGELRDWEIFNSSNKGNRLPNTFFAIRTQVGANAPQVRVLEGPLQAPHALSHGYHPLENAGLPRMAGTQFSGEYPLASIQFEEASLPVDVRLDAFTPLIPLEPADSGIPCAVLTYTVTNRTDQPVSTTLVGSITNPVGGIQSDQFFNLTSLRVGQSINSARADAGLSGLYMQAAGIEPGELDFGTVALTTDHPSVSIKPAWRRGAWFDFLREFWDDLVSDGVLTDLGYTTPSPDRKPDTGSLALTDTLSPGETKSYRFILTWHFPNRINSWDPSQTQKRTRNQYATRFSDAWDVAHYVVSELPRLSAETQTFHDALFGTTLPGYVVDAVSANIVPLRSNTCFWLEDGRFYGWEGCFDKGGSCAGSCTHVWSYAQTLAFLFPSLEREMRRIEFMIETEADGYMSFRNFGSFGERFKWTFWDAQKPEAAVDGQMGSILRVYREWQLSGNKDWLSQLWPAIKSALDYASMNWDTNHDHVLDGKQHNTYDIEFYGPNPLGGIYYLAALRAVEAMARVMDEPDVAEKCRAAAVMGSKNLDSLLWNGEYFTQKLDDVDAYPYQHGIGCLSDQVLGQLHAHIVGLGYVTPPDHMRSAVKSIFEHNFRENFHDHINCQRTYVLNDESGLIACSWPQGGQPKFPFVYSDEVWTGIEYQVAAHLIYEGWVSEGLQIVQSVRERHDGIRRNPWNEVECGHHYARSMASWAVLLALTGFHCDLGRGEISFAPVLEASSEADTFSTFWSAGTAWGTYTQHRDPINREWIPELHILYGALDGVTVTACGKSWTL